MVVPESDIVRALSHDAERWILGYHYDELITLKPSNHSKTVEAKVLANGMVYPVTIPFKDIKIPGFDKPIHRIEIYLQGGRIKEIYRTEQCHLIGESNSGGRGTSTFVFMSLSLWQRVKQRMA